MNLAIKKEATIAKDIIVTTSGITVERKFLLSEECNRYIRSIVGTMPIKIARIFIRIDTNVPTFDDSE